VLPFPPLVSILGKMHPVYTARERLADGIIHGLGFFACLVALPILMAMTIRLLPAASVASLAVYAAASLAMFGFSAAYNLIQEPNWKDWLRRCDQAAIFVKIGGTYTPFALLVVGGIRGIGLFVTVWIVALTAAVARLFFPDRLDRVAVGLYLALGWAVLLVIRPLAAALPLDALILLIVGGVLYTLGVVFHMWKRLAYQNAIWHGFVLAAASCHYAAVLRAVTFA
jgi:hemolysin III